MIKLRLVMVAIIAGLVIGCARKDGDVASAPAGDDTVVTSQKADKESAEQHIRKQGAATARAFEMKDANALSTFYADDALLLPPGTKAMNGRADVQGYWSEAFEMPNFSLKIQEGSITVSDAGDMAYENGTYSFSGDTQQGPVKDQGKYLVVWRRMDDGSWKIVADMWNSDGATS